MPTLQELISGALAGVRNPRTGADVLAADMVRDIATTTDGKVRLTMLIGANDDAALVRDVRQAIEAIPGVIDVRVDVRDPRQQYQEPTPARRALPVMDTAPAKAPKTSAPVSQLHPPWDRSTKRLKHNKNHAPRETAADSIMKLREKKM